MENLKTEILKCYEELPKEIVNSNPGCVNLAKLGKNMSEHGIDYKRCGYGKLKDFISSLKVFDLHTDNSKQIPVVYVSKIINRKRIQTNKPKSTESPTVFPYAGIILTAVVFVLATPIEISSAIS